MEINRLVSPAEILAAKSMLFEEYCIRCDYWPKPCNPSLQKVELIGGKEVLSDKFDELAEWFGVFEPGFMVGVFRRLHMKPGNCRFEIENYTTIPAAIIHGDFPVEVNRIAIIGTTRQRIERANALCQSLVSMQEEERSSFFGASPIRGMQRIFRKQGFQEWPDSKFWYHPQDPDPAIIFFKLP